MPESDSAQGRYRRSKLVGDLMGDLKRSTLRNETTFLSRHVVSGWGNCSMSCHDCDR